MNCGPYSTHHMACDCREKTVRDLVKAVYNICKSYAVLVQRQNSGYPAEAVKEREGLLADSINDAERIARKL